MKITNLQASEVEPKRIKDLEIGNVFMSERTWPGKVFMRIWDEKITRIKFTCLHDTDTRNRGGQTWGFSNTSKHADEAVVIYDPTLDLGDPQ